MKLELSLSMPCVEQANNSNSELLSLENTNSEKTGATLTDVLKTAWASSFTTKSDFARINADLIAMAASDGFITTRVAAGLYGNRWHISAAGLRHYQSLTSYSEE